MLQSAALERKSVPVQGKEDFVSAERIFSICTNLVLPGWLLLVFLPRWRYSARLISGAIIPAVLGAVYLVLVVIHLPGSSGGFGSLAQVAELFRNEFALLAGWIHYLAFDLFIGSWEVRDSERLGIPHLAVVPCLVLTFLLGPIGLLMYLGLRMVWKRKLYVDESVSLKNVAAFRQ